MYLLNVPSVSSHYVSFREKPTLSLEILLPFQVITVKPV